MRGYVGLVAVGTLLTLPCQLHAVIIAARSVALADVSSAVASASDGDAVVVPAGSASLTSPLTITKAITLRGAGENATVILDDIAGLAACATKAASTGACGAAAGASGGATGSGAGAGGAEKVSMVNCGAATGGAGTLD